MSIYIHVYIYVYVCVCVYIYIVAFRFWGTGKELAELLHRYIHGNVVCCLHPPITYIWHFSPCYPSPTSLPPAVPPLFYANRPQCVMLPSLCPCVLIVQYMWCLIFCSCISLLRMMVSRFIHVPTKDTNSSFLWLHSIHGVYVPHFPCPV